MSQDLQQSLVADNLLVTKLRRPQVRPEVVTRPRLIERMASAWRAPLTLVSAPAGFGKTTLLASWCASAAASGVETAWLSLEPADDEPVRFLRYPINSTYPASNAFCTLSLHLRVDDSAAVLRYTAVRIQPHFETEVPMEKIRLILGVVVVLVGVAILAGLVGDELFRQQIRREVKELFAKSKPPSGDAITEVDLQGLPEPVQRWLRHTGTVGQRPVATVRLTQRGAIRGAPGQPWAAYQAEQYFTMDPPGFIWSGALKQGLLPVRARDRYDDGKGTMLVKLFSLIPVADAKGPNNDQSTLARYLAEMSWFPTAALSPYIRWEAIDAGSARATMSHGGATVSAVFRFDEAGDVTSSEMQRYCDLTGRMELFEGRPEGGTWKLASGDLEYVRPENLEVEYDVPTPY